MDILKELFLGNISPDIAACKSKEFKETLSKYNKRSEVLRETLSDESKKLLDDVLDEYMHIA